MRSRYICIFTKFLLYLLNSILSQLWTNFTAFRVCKNKTQFGNRSQDTIWYLEKDTRTAMAHIILAFANSRREVLEKVQYKVNGHCMTSSEKVIGY